MSAPSAADTVSPSGSGPDPRRIFLSGSTADFGEARLTLREALARGGCHVIHEADFPQTQARTVLKLAHLIAPCGVLIHLIGTQPGSVPRRPLVEEFLASEDQDGAFLKTHPDLRARLGDFSGLTYTQWEALIALHRGLALFVYADPTHGDLAHPQRLHLDRLRSISRHPSPFADTTDLYVKVMADLMYHYGQTFPAAQLPEIFRRSLHQLPPRPEGFVGREEDLRILRALDPASGALLTGLRGMGGIGKTALAVVLAHEWAPRFPDAQLFLDARGTQTAPPSEHQLMEQVILAFHPTAKLPDDAAAIAGIYREVLDGKKVLILLDNALGAAQAAPLIPPAGCALIVTSRHSFTLGTARPHDVGRLPDAEAVALLRAYHDALTDAEAAALVQLCTGLPLALRLAGSRLALDGAAPNVAAYVKALGSGRLKHLDAEAPDAGEITISETLRLSEAPLPEAERAAWRALGVFTADFEARAAEAIAGADEEMLRRFVRRSLLEREGAERYKVHDLAADYARAQLTADALTGLHLAHARHYTAVGDEADTTYMKGDAVGGLALFDRERAQLEAAQAWLDKVVSGFSPSHRTPVPDAPGSESGRDEAQDYFAATARQVIALVNAVAYTGDLRFHPRQRIAWLESQLRAARVAKHREAEGAALGNLGLAHYSLGDARKAIEYHEQHREIAREIGDRRGEGNALGSLGNAHAALGDARKAIEFYEQSLVIAREIGDRRGEGQALGNLGTAHYSLGDARKAIEFYEQRLVIAREIGDRRGEGTALGNLGSAHAGLGDARKAIEFYEQGLVIDREIGDRRGEATDLWNAARAHDSLGDRPEAIARAAAALAIYEAIEDPWAAQVRAELAEWRGGA